MAIRVAINGFGRIGRQAFKLAIRRPELGLEVVGINDLTDAATLAYLLKHDTVYGLATEDITADGESIVVAGQRYPVSAIKEPAELPWRSLDVDVVIESTGLFVDRAGAEKHLAAGAKRVVISAPSKGENPAPTVVLGVNPDDVGKDAIINNASCTTNCIAPTIAVLQAAFGIKKAMMTTVHAYTQDQMLQDGPHKDLRRARAAAENIVPTTTGAAIATTEAIPALRGIFDGMSIRVPVPCGSISDITALLEHDVTVAEVNEAFAKAASQPRFHQILTTTTEPLVSSDIVGSAYSAIVDLSLTQVVDGDMVKVFAWYDNEFGYSSRLIEQVAAVGRTITVQPT